MDINRSNVHRGKKPCELGIPLVRQAVPEDAPNLSFFRAQEHALTGRTKRFRPARLSRPLPDIPSDSPRKPSACSTEICYRIRGIRFLDAILFQRLAEQYFTQQRFQILVHKLDAGFQLLQHRFSDM